MSPFRAGVIAITVIVLVIFISFTKFNPFADPYELSAVFRDAKNLQSGAPVRIAGVEVGKVASVESIDGAARVTMELSDDALPLHEDAQLEVRPRILLEGNFFVDVEPGSPSADELDDGATVGVTQTTTAVTLPDILDVLNADVRSDLQSLLYEYGTVALKEAAPRRSTGPSPRSRRRTGTRRSPTRPCSGSSPSATSSGCCAASSECSPPSTTTRRSCGSS